MDGLHMHWSIGRLGVSRDVLVVPVWAIYQYSMIMLAHRHYIFGDVGSPCDDRRSGRSLRVTQSFLFCF